MQYRLPILIFYNYFKPKCNCDYEVLPLRTVFVNIIHISPQVDNDRNEIYAKE